MKFSEFKGVRFLVIVLVGYGVMLGIYPQKGWEALRNSGAILESLIGIFLLVIVITALVNFFLKPHQFVKHFGDKNSRKGWFLSISSGVLSHGPMYAWYPMLQEMRERGVRDGFIVAFLYARSIKLPLLPLMIDYFGWIFTITLTVYILLGSYVQGKIAGYFGDRAG